MPLIKSAKKKMRQDIKRRDKNKALKSYIKNLKKKTIALLSTDKMGKEEAITALNFYKSNLDKIAAKKIFKKNKSSRLKSKIDLLFKKNFSEMAATK